MREYEIGDWVVYSGGNRRFVKYIGEIAKVECKIKHINLYTIIFSDGKRINTRHVKPADFVESTLWKVMNE